VLLSVIIPTIDEVDHVARAVAIAKAIGDEVIVADGGSSDGTCAVAARAGAIVIEAPRGRGRQLRAGAERARGDALLFLHADVEVPASARQAIDAAFGDPSVVGGNFLLRFVPPSFAARMFGWANDVRRRWLRVYYGDSGIFVRKNVYDALGGFRTLPILEDYDFVRRLERHGKTAYVRSVVITASARRFIRAPLRTLFVWTWIQILYSVFSVSPDRLAGHYANIRDTRRTGGAT
jgi:rSAM/selenodomain-associated transferase 2